MRFQCLTVDVVFDSTVNYETLCVM